MTRQNKRYRPSSASSDESTLIQATESSSSLPVGEKVESKKAKFDRRYKVATTSPEDVLGGLFFILIICALMIWIRTAKAIVVFCSVCTLFTSRDIACWRCGQICLRL
jgi:hypothetical protein